MSATASRPGPAGAIAMTTLAGPTIVATPEAISQVSVPSAWTMAISLSLRAASIAAMWARPLPTTKMCSASASSSASSSAIGSASAMAASAWSAARTIAVDDRVAPPPLEQAEQQELRGDERGREGLGHDRHVARAAART